MTSYGDHAHYQFSQIKDYQPKNLSLPVLISYVNPTKYPIFSFEFPGPLFASGTEDDRMITEATHFLIPYLLADQKTII